MDSEQSAWMRTYGLLGAAAVQLVGAVVGMAWLGWWLDARWGTSPVLTVVCSVLGSVGGFWNLWQILKWIEQGRRSDSGAVARGSDDRDASWRALRTKERADEKNPD